VPRVYLDHAATTPLDERVRAVVLAHLEGEWGNASSVHTFGRAARAAVETAREQVAAALAVTPLEVLFTSGGTESDNQAVSGIAWAGREAGRGAHLVTTAIEHHAVGETCRWLAAHAGFEVTAVPPGPDGVVDPERLLAAVRSDTVLVSVMAANNELGTLQPVAEIAPALRERGVPLHTDAVQAFGRIPLQLDGVAALSLSAHKFHGPQGVGVLVLRRDVAAEPVLHGGGQERGVRSGTLNVAGIAGCGLAVQIAAEALPREAPRMAALRDRLSADLLALDGVHINGHPVARIPSHLSVGVAGCDGEALQLGLDAAGVAVSLGSACQSGATERSHVLAAIGAAEDRAHVRFSLGRTTTAQDVAYAADAFADVVKRLRGAGGGYV
jgi:cysteine desulfurase